LARPSPAPAAATVQFLAPGIVTMGKLFTGADIKCTWDLLQGKAPGKLRLNPRKAWYRNLDEVTTSDDKVTFHLKRPQPYLLVLLASGVSPVYPATSRLGR
jgi:peptide/nickel transport system substrate-binding protein